MSKLRNIIKSRFIEGESLPEWYESRLGKCSRCGLNSANINNSDKSLLRKGWGVVAGEHCTHKDCGCTITEKAKIEEESCPIDEWQAIKEVNSTKLDISTTSTKVKMDYDPKSQRYNVNYGDIPYHYDSSVILLIANEDLEDLKVTSSCGCTTAQPTKTSEGTELEIKYDTKRVGKFGKNVTLTYGPKKERKQTIINIRGTVQNKR